ncbi:gluconokinase [Chryseolinea lacunae]|uniref:Gluconokinase n=1 Tax=Chryseolinea lacunae TaxID=2801331 RepID=A0ABS1KRM7_9BACT|nr:gluconokinase [Chryseolinea lacunae]MBL0741322.1 gluconokinase [Chryseolinea lacunae]
MKYTIGIDIGTGSTKAVAVDTTGHVLGTAQAAYPTLNPEPIYSEQDPEKIRAAFVSCINTLVAEVGHTPAGIVISSAMHSLLFVDAHAKPLHNMITWADNRGAAIARRIKDSAEGETIYRQTGTPVHAMAPLSKVVWLKENDPALFQRVAKFISIKEYIWFNLFGVFEVDYSIASATGLFDIAALTWNSTALTVCGLTPERLGTPVPTHHSRTGLSSVLASELAGVKDVPFFIGSSDGCMANLGSFAVSPGIAALTIGTSGAIRVANVTPTFNFKAMTFNYRLNENTFISGGPINNGGYVLKWYAEVFLQRKLNSSNDYAALLDGLDQVEAGANGLIFLPYLLGERAPIWDSDASGAFFGIRNFHTQAHFTRAVVEGISLALYSIARAMEQAGLVIQRVHVSGGFVHSKAWLQILADVFGKEICLINPEDASALGAAYLGLKSLGLVPDYEALRPAERVSYFPVAENHERYTKTFAMYERLYENLKDEMTDIQALRHL